jgi:hypothetical protein
MSAKERRLLKKGVSQEQKDVVQDHGAEPQVNFSLELFFFNYQNNTKYSL